MNSQPLTTTPFKQAIPGDPVNAEILVLGVGNYLMGDEGVGVHIANEMSKQNLPHYIDVVDGGTGGFALMGYFDQYPTIILVDATIDGKPPGSVTITTPKFASDYPKALSVHDVGLKDMIDAVYLLEKVPNMKLITVSIDEIIPMNMNLSPPVEKSIVHVISKILELSEKIHSH